MAYTSVTYTFSNSTTADATQVNQNFTDLINGLSDGTKDINVNAATLAGNLTVNGSTTIGNATSDTLTITARLAATVAPSTTATYDLGTTTLLFNNIYSTYLPASLGAVTTPSHTFNGDLNTGMYSSGADTLDFATGGTNRLSISSAGVLTLGTSGLIANVLGAVGAPSYSFTGDTNTGIWSSASDTLNFSTAGSERMRIESDGRIKGSSAIHRNLSTTQDTTSLTSEYIESGIVTVTPTNSLNTTISGTSNARFIRVGRVVHVTGSLTFSVTSTSALAQINLPVPIASSSNLSAQGTAVKRNTATTKWFSGEIEDFASATNVHINIYSDDTSSTQCVYSYTYTIS